MAAGQGGRNVFEALAIFLCENFRYDVWTRGVMDGLQQFLKQYPTKKFEPGQIIFIEGEVPERAFVIKSGVVKIYYLTKSGDEKPINLTVPGDIIPFPWLFGNFNRLLYYYQAFFGPCEAYSIPPNELKDFIFSEPKALKSVFERTCTHYIGSMIRVSALEYSKAADKVAHTLHYFSLRYGKDIKRNTVEIQLPLTHQELANFMGLTRETTGLELKKLEKAGVLSYRQQQYVIQTDKLNNLLDEEYDLGRTAESKSSNEPLI